MSAPPLLARAAHSRLNGEITSAGSLISETIHEIKENFTNQDQQDNRLEITIRYNGNNVSEEVAKNRGEDISAKLKDAGIIMDIKINYVKATGDLISITSEPK
jgi:hypothetical protein